MKDTKGRTLFWFSINHEILAACIVAAGNTLERTPSATPENIAEQALKIYVELDKHLANKDTAVPT